MKHPHKFITEEEVHEIFDVEKFDPIGTLPYDTVLVLEGDITLDGDLTLDSIEDLIFDGERETEEELIIVKGNLTIKGDLDLGEEYPNIVVMGDLHCDVLNSSDDLIHVTGDAHVKYVFNGNYNHGQIVVEGTTHVPYVLNSDHCSDIKPVDSAIIINYYSNYDDFFDNDYYDADLPNVLVEEALYDGEMDYEQFIEVVKAGKSPFKEGAKSQRELLLEEIEKMGAAGQTTDESKKLDLTEQNLRTLPTTIGQIKNLETLILEKNRFKELPTEIGNLTHLKELNIKAVPIKDLPDSIGQLKNLEVLNLAYCRGLKTLPESIGDLTNLKKLVLWSYEGDMPASVSKLTQLEELEILDVYKKNSDGEIIGFPNWVFEFKGLKKLRFNKAYISEEDMAKLLALNPDIEVAK